MLAIQRTDLEGQEVLCLEQLDLHAVAVEGGVGGVVGLFIAVSELHESGVFDTTPELGSDHGERLVIKDLCQK